VKAASSKRSEGAERRGETEEERLDRNLSELLQELRVVLTGNQVLFAFLLILPFSAGWDTVTEFETTVFYVTLILVAASSVCLIAPTVRHRMRFRELDKKWVVESANRLAIAGMAFLAGAMAGVLMLISAVVYSGTLVAITTGVFAVAVAWFWFAAPFVRGLGEDD
jgi:hypothetical protein